jgi:hypothetical protein
MCLATAAPNKKGRQGLLPYLPFRDNQINLLLPCTYHNVKHFDGSIRVLNCKFNGIQSGIATETVSANEPSKSSKLNSA